MLYQWLETQRTLMRSMDAWAALTAAPWGAWAASGNCGAAGPSDDDGARVAPLALPGCDWMVRLLQASPEPPPFGIETVDIDGQTVAVTETIADRTPFCALRAFARGGKVRAAHRGEHRADAENVRQARHASAPERAGRHRRTSSDALAAELVGSASRACVLLVTPLAGHHAVMLRETVETLLESCDVYVTDWANARDVPLAHGKFGLDDYVLALERFLRLLGGRGVHVVAVCQAAPPALAASALIAASRDVPAPLSVTLMGGPIDTRLHPTMIDRLAATHDIEWFRHTVIDVVPQPYLGVGRRIYPGYVQHAAIVAAHPHRQLALESRYWKSRLAGDARTIAKSLRALNEYSAVLDMDERYFLDTLRIVFQEQRLARGEWSIGGRRVAPEALCETALCTIEGDRDDITGAGQTHAAHNLCSSLPDAMRMRLTIDDCDHYDLFTGPRWHEAIYPALRSFWMACASNPSSACRG
jgi:polyhydroxyalkanoate depolymerase